jgi:quinol monooxygenase YgiN
MILRLVKMHFKADETANFLCYFETIKAKIEGMPGILSLKLYQDEKDPNVFFTHSTWLNQSSLDNYRQSETFGNIWPKTKVLFASEPMAWSLKLK